LNFRDDVYQHDSELIKKMFEQPSDNSKDITKVIRIDNVNVSKDQ